MDNAQRNYATIHKELLSIILAIDQFRHYLFGRQFVVVTDHKPLTALFRQTKLSSRLLRWKIELSEYDFKIIHIPGKQNVVADCLSRMELESVDMTPKYLDEFLDKSINTTVLQVVTRSRAKETQLLQQQSSIDKSKLMITDSESKSYFIEENNHVEIEQKNFDQIYYLLEKRNCDILQRMQIRLKRKIAIDDPTIYYHLYGIDSVRRIIFIPQVDSITNFGTKMELVVSQIFKHATDEVSERIAVNVEIKNAAKYFELKRIYRMVFKNSEIQTTFFLNKIMAITSLDDIRAILITYHQSKLGGHVGRERMKNNNIRRFYEWPSMTKDIKDHVRNCPVCEKTKIDKHTRTPMQITSVASQPFEKIYIDYVGEISPSSSEGFKYILTCQCDLTKYIVAVPTRDCTAETAARALVNNVCLVFGIPKTVVSDNGSAFISKLFGEIAGLMKIKQTLIAPYHPQSNSVERFHRTMGQFLRAYTQSEPDGWHDYLPYAVFNYNNRMNIQT